MKKAKKELIKQRNRFVKFVFLATLFGIRATRLIILLIVKIIRWMILKHW